MNVLEKVKKYYKDWKRGCEILASEEIREWHECDDCFHNIKCPIGLAFSSVQAPSCPIRFVAPKAIWMKEPKRAKNGKERKRMSSSWHW